VRPGLAQALLVSPVQALLVLVLLVPSIYIAQARGLECTIDRYALKDEIVVITATVVSIEITANCEEPEATLVVESQDAVIAGLSKTIQVGISRIADQIRNRIADDGEIEVLDSQGLECELTRGC